MVDRGGRWEKAKQENLWVWTKDKREKHISFPLAGTGSLIINIYRTQSWHARSKLRGDAVALCSVVGVVPSRGLEKGIPLTLGRYVILDA